MLRYEFKDLILFENEDYIVINKPPHVATINERTADKSISILRMAKEYSHDAQVAHRLDKETSGVLAIAKNPAAYRHIAMQFEYREVTKRYHAVANGVHDFDSISVFLPIAPLKDGTAVKIDRQNGKAAETVFFTKQAFRKHTLVECIPITGRMHQIRVHLQCLKAPIVCDPTYGGATVYLSELKRNYNLKKDSEELPIIQRVALHAFSLTFRLMNDETVVIEAPYPKDFGVLVKLLEKNS
ncbi:MULTISPECIES: RluA family pseudouridine synthase [Runella]|jgi:23S rRNA pseudouridine955/2504/2580 synthase|uniref:23S rRNA pseudouridine955/2504/2580 synthase n=1 Tax=Runella defluvii TaxID=370973 RepID=A0A7W5ZL39_9BACT|nr:MULTISPECIES: RluA family pseudouridine synthase [Runella]AYQ35272.1 RluA family pseudouridine synthase [Runella sp. SP2]MBB3838690.1 23S rRNA pseudouridine955/2504/2580 synthase [Runella defluvii]MCA0229170.1 RluA family pseudouridine synthase [Bacteroidota bacterium]